MSEKFVRPPPRAPQHILSPDELIAQLDPITPKEREFINISLMANKQALAVGHAAVVSVEDIPGDIDVDRIKIFLREAGWKALTDMNGGLEIRK